MISRRAVLLGWLAAWLGGCAASFVFFLPAIVIASLPYAPAMIGSAAPSGVGHLSFRVFDAILGSPAVSASNVLIAIFGSAAGGYYAASMAPRSKLVNGAASGLLFALFGLVGSIFMMVQASRGVHVSPSRVMAGYAEFLLAVPSALLGASVRRRVELSKGTASAS